VRKEILKTLNKEMNLKGKMMKSGNAMVPIIHLNGEEIQNKKKLVIFGCKMN
jgi:hypothetical protein